MPWYLMSVQDKRDVAACDISFSITPRWNFAPYSYQIANDYFVAFI